MKNKLIYLFGIIAFVFIASGITVYAATNGSDPGDEYDDAETLDGIDVSSKQGTITWSSVADAVDFVIIRAGFSGYGVSSYTYNEDTNFEDNIEEAYEENLNIGVYYFSQATTVAEAKAEANYLLDIISDYKSEINLQVYMDYEYDDNNVGRLYKADLTATQHTKIVNAFCKVIENAGYTAGVYGNKTMLLEDLNLSSIDNNYTVWAAKYSSSLNSVFSDLIDIWQYSDEGTVSGVATTVDLDYMYIFEPDKVTGLEVTSDEGDSSVSLSWDKVTGVYGYEVYRAVSGESTYTKVATVKGASKTIYADSSITQGTTYVYKVRAIYSLRNVALSEETGDFSSTVTAKTLESPTIKSASTSSSGIKLYWTESDGATGYKVYRKTSSGSYKLVATTTSLSYTDSTAQAGVKYTYMVRAYLTTDSGNVYSTKKSSLTKTVKTYYPQQADDLSTSTSSSGIKVSWSKVTGADGYYVYRKEADGSYTKIKTTTSLSYTDSTAEAGVSYTYVVRAYNKVSSKKYLSALSSKYSVTVTTKYPQSVDSVSATGTKSGTVSVTWSEVEGATGYKIYRKTSGGSYKAIGTSTSLSYTDTTAKTGVVYTYSVRAYNTTSSGKYFAAKDFSVHDNGRTNYPQQPDTITVSEVTSGVKVTWNKVSGATGYVVYRKEDDGSYTKIKTTTSLSYTDKSVESGETYTYVIRAYYKTSSKTYYSKLNKTYAETITYSN